ncbi:Flagellar basal-body rod protein FlgB [Candidatus Magnetoovum chiemensis]|nr:Flagellar basal-body rod protein FlgB [Candidatus Magnetoovum chiemensis]
MDSGVNFLKSVIKYSSLRQTVLASNMANSETPGYSAKDLSFDKLFNKEQLRLTVTKEGHIGSASLDNLNTLITPTETDHWGDDNNIEIDEEVAKMTENALLGQAAMKLLSTKLTMYQSAIVSRQ